MIRKLTIPWKPGEIIPGTTLRFIGDTGRTREYQQKNRRSKPGVFPLILVECVEHKNQFEILFSNVAKGHSKGCGGNKDCIARNTTAERIIWQRIHQLCMNPTADEIAKADRTGIHPRICARWRDFELFLLDVGLANGRKLVLLEPKGEYSSANCRWAL